MSAIAVSLQRNCANTLVRKNGEGGIRTLDRVASIQHFQCCAFDRSATSPSVTAIYNFNI